MANFTNLTWNTTRPGSQTWFKLWNSIQVTDSYHIPSFGKTRQRMWTYSIEKQTFGLF